MYSTYIHMCDSATVRVYSKPMPRVSYILVYVHICAGEKSNNEKKIHENAGPKEEWQSGRNGSMVAAAAARSINSSRPSAGTVYVRASTPVSHQIDSNESQNDQVSPFNVHTHRHRITFVANHSDDRCISMIMIGLF